MNLAENVSTSEFSPPQKFPLIISVGGPPLFNPAPCRGSKDVLFLKSFVVDMILGHITCTYYIDTFHIQFEDR